MHHRNKCLFRHFLINAKQIKKSEKGSHWATAAAGQTTLQHWPQIDSSVSGQPASSSTQHPHCPLCQHAIAALLSSGGCLRRTHYRYMLALAWLSVYCMEHSAERRQGKEGGDEKWNAHGSYWEPFGQLWKSHTITFISTKLEITWYII